MQTNLETIRAACIKANPSILDLTFGCELEIESAEYNISHCLIYDINSNPNNKFVPFDIITSSGRYIPTSSMDGHFNNRASGGGWKIIGRPIRLADVFLALQGKHGTIGTDYNGYFIDCDENCNDVKDCKGSPIWNLLKDDIREQSPETLSFIAEFINKS